MTGYEIDHNADGLIIVHGIQRKQLCGITEKGSVEMDEAEPLEDFFLGAVLEILWAFWEAAIVTGFESSKNSFYKEKVMKMMSA